MADAEGNTYGPFDVSVPDSEAEAFTEEAYYRIHDETGVVEGFALSFAGLTAQVGAGFAWSHGAYLLRETPWLDTSPATTGDQPRRDLLVLRRTLTVGEGDEAVPGRVVPMVLRGAPAAAPANPEHDADTDLRLWSWQVPANGGTVVTGQQDHRTYVRRDGASLSDTDTPVMVLHGAGLDPIAPGVLEKVSLTVLELGEGDGLAHISGEVRVDKEGVYRVSGLVVYAVGTQVGRRHLAAVARNGAYLIRSQGRVDPAQNNTLPIATASALFAFSVGDRISLYTRQDTTAAQEVDRAQSMLAVEWVRPLS